MDAESPTDVRLTDTQLRILVALCRPIAANHFATPATNQEIAGEVFLSVDAVKGHLRTLYRKFGIEDLAHNQKRARLVELAVEGGYLAGTDAVAAEPVEEPGPVAPMADAPAAAADAVSTPTPDGKSTSTSAAEPTEVAGAASTPASAPERGLGVRDVFRMNGSGSAGVALRVGGVLVLLAIVAAVLAIAGVFSSGSADAGAPTPAAFRAKVAGYCKLALAGAPAPGGSRVDRAQGYLEVIETMRGRYESLTPPAGKDLALERFGAGLTTSADFTSAVAEAPPAAGSRAEAKDVSELTFAAGQVQAGAVGYGLGHDCLEIGDLVADSAENAAAP